MKDTTILAVLAKRHKAENKAPVKPTIPVEKTAAFSPAFVEEFVKVGKDLGYGDLFLCSTLNDLLIRK